MKRENKILIGLLTGIMLITIIGGYLTFQKEENNKNVTDAIKMKEEYSSLNDKINENTKMKYPEVLLSDNNPFVYKTEEEIIKILEGKSGIIYFGFSSCPWCRTMLPILEEVAKEEKIEEISYLNIKDIRDVLELDENSKIVTKTKGTDGYYKILKLLEEYLEEYILISKDKSEVNSKEKRLYAPTVIVVKNGVIEGFHSGTVETQKNGFEELSEEEEKELKSIYQTMLKKLKENSCKEGC